MARPQKNADEKKAASLPSIRVTDADRVHVETQAQAASLTLSEYIYSRATGHQVTPRPSKLEASTLSELNKIGVNLNQIAHARNSGRDDPAILKYVLEELHTLMAKIGEAV